MSRIVKTWVSTTQDEPWRQSKAIDKKGNGAALDVSALSDQAVDGFGGCFNELGWAALQRARPAVRDQVLSALFDPSSGCAFRLCRLPIGASDYAEDWYSLDEESGDYKLESFSIERDRERLIPYVKAALTVQPGLEFFASPWSPPTWMKRPSVYNYGTLRMDPEVLRAYALYFLKYLRAYREEGIDVSRLFPQNEPFADQKFPSCLWSADQFIVFIRDYLGPLFEREREGAQIWLGTLNGPELMTFGPGGIKLDSFEAYVERILLDEGAARFIKGIGYQWAGRAHVRRTRESFPALKVMQTENECGDGRNSWDYAFYVYDLLRHYLGEGASAYVYWNMVLESGGKSSWGWNQNSMVTIDTATGEAIYNPEFYVMRHFSAFVRPGALRLFTSGQWTGSSLAFRDRSGDLVVVAANLQDRPRTIELLEAGEPIASLELKAKSINTIVME
jgi:O-Glycosyl hydrolase